MKEPHAMFPLRCATAQ